MWVGFALFGPATSIIAKSAKADFHQNLTSLELAQTKQIHSKLFFIEGSPVSSSASPFFIDVSENPPSNRSNWKVR
jgi:hypothetical protein